MLLSGEYAVLDGAKALALPTFKGQKITISNTRGSDLRWQSKDQNGDIWFDTSISLFDFSVNKTSNEEISAKLQRILKNAVRLNSEFLSQWNGFKIQTELEFPLDWGLGSSSTLIDLIAQWADIEPLELFFKCEAGSGYDVACAAADAPMIYQSNDESISYYEVDFKPDFMDKLFFVHLDKKQSSSESISDYSKNAKNVKTLVKEINAITEALLKNKSFQGFCKLVDQHEELISKHCGFQKVKEKLFSDFQGSIKSLGAWGGDFVLAASKNDPSDYFKQKGYTTIVPFKEMVRGVN